MKYLFILPMLFSLYALPAYAQEGTQDDIQDGIVDVKMEDVQKTRREQIVHDLMLKPEGAIVEVKATEDQVTVGIVTEDIGKKDEEIDVTVLEPRDNSSEKTILDTLLDAISAEIFTPKEQPKPKTIIKKITRKIVKKIAPFYLSAESYLEERSAGAGPQLVLHYEVASGAASGAGLGTVKDVKLTFGEDFAAMRVDKNLTIYDFKLDRILSVKPEYNMAGKTTGKLLFENTSLYAKVYRDIAAVRRATNNGRLTTLDMGQGTTLDAYWVESAMSWSVGKSEAELKIKNSKNAVKIIRGGVTIFSAEFTDKAYANRGSKNSLFAFAHHEWPLHPSVLRALYAYGSPPKWFEMLSYGPAALKGQKQVWTLVERADIDAEFPLPPGAIGSAQSKNVSPLVFLINEAVHDRALGGIKSVDVLMQDFKTKMDAEAYGQAWILGQKYAAYSGGCKNPDDLTICNAAANIEQTRKDDLPKRIQDYMTAVSAARKGQKGDAVTMIAPYLDKKETPAFIIRTAAMARAKIKSSKAKEMDVVSINAENLLLTALAKDPYDPNTYVGLAQVLAAKGAFEQSWDVYDALRVGIPTASSLDLKINRLEQKLRKTAPGYFLE